VLPLLQFCFGCLWLQWNRGINEVCLCVLIRYGIYPFRPVSISATYFIIVNDVPVSAAALSSSNVCCRLPFQSPSLAVCLHSSTLQPPLSTGFRHLSSAASSHANVAPFLQRRQLPHPFYYAPLQSPWCRAAHISSHYSIKSSLKCTSTSAAYFFSSTSIFVSMTTVSAEQGICIRSLFYIYIFFFSKTKCCLICLPIL
jgi:hypothetical protein